MASTIKVDNIETVAGSGDITLNNNVASLTSSGAISGTNITATASGAPLTVNSTNSNNLKITFQNNGSAVSYMGGLTDGVVFGNSSGTQLGRLDADGLKFGTDSVAANALGDYEEGAWTPTDASGAGLTFSNITKAGRYVKIGSLVFVSIYFNYPTTSNTSHALVGGLPFTSVGAYHYLNGRAQSNQAGNITCQINALSTEWVFYDSDAIRQNADMSGKYVLISGCYETSA